MTSIDWDVRLTLTARKDLVSILKVSEHRFGSLQARRYKSLLISALSALKGGPDPLGSASRDDIASGVRTYRIDRTGRRGRHVLLYRTAGPMTIEVIRILHDRMNIPQHLPPAAP